MMNIRRNSFLIERVRIFAIVLATGQLSQGLLSQERPNSECAASIRINVEAEVTAKKVMIVQLGRPGTESLDNVFRVVLPVVASRSQLTICGESPMIEQKDHKLRLLFRWRSGETMVEKSVQVKKWWNTRRGVIVNGNLKREILQGEREIKEDKGSGFQIFTLSLAPSDIHGEPLINREREFLGSVLVTFATQK